MNLRFPRSGRASPRREGPGGVAAETSPPSPVIPAHDPAGMRVLPGQVHRARYASRTRTGRGPRRPRRIDAPGPGPPPGRSMSPASRPRRHPPPSRRSTGSTRPVSVSSRPGDPTAARRLPARRAVRRFRTSRPSTAAHPRRAGPAARNTPDDLPAERGGSPLHPPAHQVLRNVIVR